MPGYMECSCYNVLGGSLKVGDTDGYPLVWCIGRQLSYHQQGMTLCLPLVGEQGVKLAK